MADRMFCDDAPVSFVTDYPPATSASLTDEQVMETLLRHAADQMSDHALAPVLTELLCRMERQQLLAEARRALTSRILQLCDDRSQRQAEAVRPFVAACTRRNADIADLERPIAGLFNVEGATRLVASGKRFHRHPAGTGEIL